MTAPESWNLAAFVLEGLFVNPVTETVLPVTAENDTSPKSEVTSPWTFTVAEASVRAYVKPMTTPNVNAWATELANASVNTFPVVALILAFAAIEISAVAFDKLTPMNGRTLIRKSISPSVRFCQPPLVSSPV